MTSERCHLLPNHCGPRWFSSCVRRCRVLADEDSVVSDDDMDYHELSSEGSDRPGRRRSGSADIDFAAEEDESGSNWKSEAKKPIKPKVCSHGRKTFTNMMRILT